jgi:hypothetical protein
MHDTHTDNSTHLVLGRPPPRFLSALLSLLPVQLRISSDPSPVSPLAQQSDLPLRLQ